MDADELRNRRIALFVKGDMPEPDRAAFEAELAADRTLAAETAAAKAVAAIGAADADAAAADGDLEDEWRRISDEIDRPPVAAPANDNRRSWFAPIAQAAAVAVAAVFMWEAFAPPTLRTDGPALYAPVSEAADGFALQVIFADDAAAGEIAALLREVDGAIRDGPSALGIYRVAFESEAARDLALETLSTRPALVASATPG